MSEELELQQYVDWQSLSYYDKRIKDYIDVCCTEGLQIGGEILSGWLSTTPVAENLNKLYVVKESFTTGPTFFESGVSCDKDSVVYLASTTSGLKYKILVRVAPSDNSLSNSVNDLSDSVSDIQSRVELLESSYIQVVNKTDTLASELKDYKKDSDHQFEIVRTSVETTQEELHDAEEAIKHVESDLQTVSHDIHDILHSHETRLNNFDNSFATKESVQVLQQKVESIPLDGYATEEYVDNKISQIPEVDLTDYAKQEDIPDVSEFVTHEDLPSVPTKVSELENDVGYLTEHQSLHEYAKLSDIPDTSGFITSIPDEYVTQEELDSEGYLKEHQSLDGLATEDFVKTEIAKAQLSGEETSVDLTHLATKTEVAAELERIEDRIDVISGIQYGTF